MSRQRSRRNKNTSPQPSNTRHNNVAATNTMTNDRSTTAPAAGAGGDPPDDRPHFKRDPDPPAESEKPPRKKPKTEEPVPATQTGADTRSGMQSDTSASDPTTEPGYDGPDEAVQHCINHILRQTSDAPSAVPYIPLPTWIVLAAWALTKVTARMSRHPPSGHLRETTRRVASLIYGQHAVAALYPPYPSDSPPPSPPPSPPLSPPPSPPAITPQYYYPDQLRPFVAWAVGKARNRHNWRLTDVTPMSGILHNIVSYVVHPHGDYYDWTLAHNIDFPEFSLTHLNFQ